MKSDGVKTSTKNKDLSTDKISKQHFLRFDGSSPTDQDPAGWIEITRADYENKVDSKFTFSALASLGSQDDLLKRREFEIDSTFFGMSTFERLNNGVEFNLGQTYEEKGTSFEPFVIKRDFHGLQESTYDIVQNFVLYHNLFFDHKQAAYFDVLKEAKVVKYISSRHICILKDYLRDYLAARKMILIRYHTYGRSLDVSMSDVFEEERIEYAKAGTDHKYWITIRPFGSNNKNAHSLLRGKDVILPYVEPKREDYVYLSNKPKRYAAYIYKIAEDGKYVEESCDQGPEGHSGRFLTPVFFEKGVLQKYYKKDRFYTVRDGRVRCLDLWDIPFGENSDGLIHVLLGDLGRIPYNEQMQWRQYNVPPRGKMNRNFVSRQLLGEFTERDSICENLLMLKDQINASFESCYEFKLFKGLPPGNEHVEANFHTLTTNEEQEFSEQILNMAKLFVDTLDQANLERNVDQSTANTGEGKSIIFLEHFLIEKCVAESDSKNIVRSFRMVQKLRSQSAAHLKSTKYDKTLQDFGLDDLTPKDRFEGVVRKFYDSLRALADLCA